MRHLQLLYNHIEHMTGLHRFSGMLRSAQRTTHSATMACPTILAGLQLGRPRVEILTLTPGCGDGCGIMGKLLSIRRHLTFLCTRQPASILALTSHDLSIERRLTKLNIPFLYCHQRRGFWLTEDKEESTREKQEKRGPSHQTALERLLYNLPHRPESVFLLAAVWVQRGKPT